MDLVLWKLNRRQYRSDGIFSDLLDATGNKVAVTLEHAYLSEFGYDPKIPSGTYLCVRGTHALKNGVPFETFEVTGVAGHTGILFHCGNFDNDSEGCVLVGDAIAETGSVERITNSRDTFDKLKTLWNGLSSFHLTVSD